MKSTDTFWGMLKEYRAGIWSFLAGISVPAAIARTCQVPGYSNTVWLYNCLGTLCLIIAFGLFVLFSVYCLTTRYKGPKLRIERHRDPPFAYMFDDNPNVLRPTTNRVLANSERVLANTERILNQMVPLHPVEPVEHSNNVRIVSEDQLFEPISAHRRTTEAQLRDTGEWVITERTIEQYRPDVIPSINGNVSDNMDEMISELLKDGTETPEESTQKNIEMEKME